MAAIEKNYRSAVADRFCKSDKNDAAIGKTNRNPASDSQNLDLAQKMRARETEDAAWTLEPHVCRECFGRLVSCPGTGGRLYRCTNCDAEAVGATAAVLCACGTTVRRHGPGAGHADAGLRCRANPSQSPEFPSAFVAVYAPTTDS